ncbi:MAG: nucleotidyltransferase domain-containing protein [Clostridia bacterium]|nr:nucleotidyltransferase domain-containing protein [Clostridia bacterium]
MTLRQLRKNKGLTQQQASDFLGVPLRTYSNYENDAAKQTSIKYKYMIEKLYTYGYVDEETGLLTLEEIKKTCISILSKYPVEYCYLFGSYAKGKATPTSDVDLLIHTSLSGLKFYGLVEELREQLKKKVDVLDQKQIMDNFELTNEILKDGIKIYG